MATIEARQSRRNRLSKCLATKLYAAKKLATFCFRIAFRYMDAVLNFAHVTRFGLRRGSMAGRCKMSGQACHASGCKTLASPSKHAHGALCCATSSGSDFNMNDAASSEELAAAPAAATDAATTQEEADAQQRAAAD